MINTENTVLLSNLERAQLARDVAAFRAINPAPIVPAPVVEDDSLTEEEAQEVAARNLAILTEEGETVFNVTEDEEGEDDSAWHAQFVEAPAVPAL